MNTENPEVVRASKCNRCGKAEMGMSGDSVCECE